MPNLLRRRGERGAPGREYRTRRAHQTSRAGTEEDGAADGFAPRWPIVYHRAANRTAMASEANEPDAYIAYPTNRVVGTIVDPKLAQAAIEALLQVGFAPQEIDVLHGEADLHRPDPTGAEHRYLAQFQRTLIRTLADEYKHLQHLVEEVRAGRNVIMVL